MYLEWLQIRQVRNLKSIQFCPKPGLNFFSGPNASGKTAVLESIYLLSRGRSFRTPRIQDVICHGHADLLVTARIHDEKQGVIITGIEKCHGETKIRYHGEWVKSISEQSRAVPIVLITQDTHTLITASPKERRHWLDWAMFHVEPDYLEIWKTYMKALRHRNALLKKGQENRDLYRAWDQAMVESGRYITTARRRFLEELTRQLSVLTQQVFAGQVRVELSSEWPGQGTAEEVFTDNWLTDLKTGFTRSGVHNADVKIRQDGKDVAALFSRGQIKLMVCLLTIAQAKLQTEWTAIRPVVLIDDYRAELDNNACEYLLYKLGEADLQVFLTDTQKPIKNNELGKLFHVEQGVVSEYSFCQALKA